MSLSDTDVNGSNLYLRYSVFFLLEMTQRDVPGFAIGGLSGGEEKDDFWRMVTLSTDHLPREKPRYLMGVGYVCQCAVRLIMTTEMLLALMLLY